MKTLRILFCMGLLALPLCLNAQSRSERSLYEKTKKNFTVKAADKFLKKYPKSIFAPTVLHMKDSVLLAAYLEANVSKVTPEQAMSVAGEAISAVGWKKEGVDRILALDQDLSLRILSLDGSLVEQRSIPVYTMEEQAPGLTLALPLEVITPLGEKNPYVHFAYRNGLTEYVEILYQVPEDIVHQAIFYGNALDGGSRIEGQSPEMMEGYIPSAEVAWLVGRMRENDVLVQIAKEDILTDDAIRWWLKKNPKAETSAQKLVFGRLDSESSIVQAYKKASKEKGEKGSAAFFDIRGYTVICSSRKGEYILLWCEPVCRNKKTEKYIRSIFFESDGTTLDVVYYKGKSTFKNKISLSNASIRHFK